MSFPLSRLTVFMAVLFGIGQGLCSQLAHSADLYRAFYYNAAGKLIQVEEVPDSDLGNRELLDPEQMSYPTLTNDLPLFDKNAQKKMSRFATVAVYYTYTPPEPAVNTRKVQAHVAKVEDLQWVDSRNLKCLKREGPDPCYYPKRCHCITNCCCY